MVEIICIEDMDAIQMGKHYLIESKDYPMAFYAIYDMNENFIRNVKYRQFLYGFITVQQYRDNQLKEILDEY